MNVAVLLAALELALKYGPGAITAAIIALNKTTITIDDIRALRIDKEPEEYK